MMDQLDRTQARAWLLQSRFNPLPVAGNLVLADGRLSFTLTDVSEDDRPALGWLEGALETPGLAERIGHGEKIVAFDVPISECQVSWPITGPDSLMLVRSARRKWVVSYQNPSTASSSSTLSLVSARGTVKLWKRALAAAARPDLAGS